MLLALFFLFKGAHFGMKVKESKQEFPQGMINKCSIVCIQCAFIYDRVYMYIKCVHVVCSINASNCVYVFFWSLSCEHNQLYVHDV